MLLFETYRTAAGARRWLVRLSFRPTDAGQGAEQANPAAVRERSELVDVDVARAAGTAPVGGGALVHIASAWEIATEMQLAGGGGEAPSSDEEGAATA